MDMREILERINENDNGKFSKLSVEVREIKRCPFCGGIATITPKRFHDELFEEYGSALVAVRCNKCSLDMSYHINSNSSDYYSKMIEAIKKWNKRV